MNKRQLAVRKGMIDAVAKGGTIFSVLWAKKNGEVISRAVRTGVKPKRTDGIVGKNNAEKFDHLYTVFDTNAKKHGKDEGKGDYRNLDLRNLLAINPKNEKTRVVFDEEYNKIPCLEVTYYKDYVIYYYETDNENELGVGGKVDYVKCRKGAKLSTIRKKTVDAIIADNKLKYYTLEESEG